VNRPANGHQPGTSIKIMKTKQILTLIALTCLSTLNLQLSAAPLGTAFTYQGRLNDGANPASGNYDLRFTVYDAVADGTLKAAVTNACVAVTNGLFMTPVDFGSGPNNASAMWLEIGVRTNGSTGDFTTVSPRQAILPAPYAFYALNSSNAVTAGSASNLFGVLPGAQLAGTYSSALTFDNAGNNFAGNGSGLSALDAGNIASGTLDDARLPANVALLNADQTFSGNNVFNLPLGIGVTPAWPLDVQGEQAVGRFTSTYGYFGSVIELRNTTTDFYPSLLGAINFNDGYDNYPGQIAYLTSDAMNFRVGGVDGLMWLDLSGLYVQGELFVQGALSGNNLYLPATTGDSGVIFSGGNPFIHAYGIANFFAGVGAGNLTMTGGENMAVGYQALLNNTSGSFNTANGCQTLASNTNGNDNTAIGEEALRYNTTGSDNTAVGMEALVLNSNGSYNTAIGSTALLYNTSGSNNIALGYGAGYNLTTGSSNIDIGNRGLSSDNNLIRIGDGQTQTFIAGVINGNGGGLTNLNAVQLTGTIPMAQLPGVVVTNNNATSVNLSGSFTGNGSALTNLNANNLTSGTVPLTRLSGITSNQLDAATWLLATNLNGGRAALASNVVAGIAITNAFITNSVFAGNGVGLANLNASQLASGTVPLAQLPGVVVTNNNAASVNLSGSFTGNGTGLTNVNAAALNGLNATNFWQLGGNNVPAGQFLGSTNNQPLELWVNNTRALRLEPTANDANHSNIVNVVGGSPVNYMAPGVYGSVIVGGGAMNYLGQANTNSVSADFSFLGGGERNSIQTNAFASFLGGGAGNSIQTNAADSFLGGGAGNSIQTNAQCSFLGGGIGNSIQPNAGDSFLGGGADNSIQTNAFLSFLGGGYFNTNTGAYAMIPGGYHNVAAASSFAAGNYAQATNTGAFVWGDNSSSSPIASTNNNSFNVRAAGGYRFYTTSSGASGAGVYLAANGNSWSSVSDRNAKKNFQPVDIVAVLDKLAAIPIQQWNYKWEKDSDVPNIGPMAQDFKAAFYPGRDDKSITTLEYDGVALAAIQGLNQKLEETVKQKDAEIQALKQSVAELKETLTHLTQKPN
jgi:hypothetical protein